jgi:hypothetical protein
MKSKRRGLKRRYGRAGRSLSERLFIGVYPAGISYADRSREKHGDYARCAFLSFGSLKLDVEPDCPKSLLGLIKRDAAKVQAKRGEQYVVSGSGQTVLLGGR